MNYKQVFAIQNTNKKRLLKHFNYIPDTSGIYILTRYDNNLKYAYIGQAKHLLSRLAQHLSGYQHIDLSLKKHGLYSEKNDAGWQLLCFSFKQEQLDDKEQEFIIKYANEGYQLRNKTSGGQGVGKEKIAEYKPAKGYRQGLEQGKKNTIKELNSILKYFDLTLKKDNKLSQRALEKLKKLGVPYE